MSARLDAIAWISTLWPGSAGKLGVSSMITFGASGSKAARIMIGLVTPPYGLLLFLMVKIADVPLKDIVRDVMPFLAVMIGALALITLFPELVLFLPRRMGYQG